MSATVIDFPRVPDNATRVVDSRPSWQDEYVLRRMAEMCRAEAKGIMCANARTALAALSDACEAWASGHTLAMAEAADMAAMLWRSRER